MMQRRNDENSKLMNRLHGETVKYRAVQYGSNVKFGPVLVSAREPEGGGWAPGDGTYKYDILM